MGEIIENCNGVKLVVVALKCDLRPAGASDPDEITEEPKTIAYKKGLELAQRIGAHRYLECSAMKNRGVNEAFTEAARVALSVKKEKPRTENKRNTWGVGGVREKKCEVM